VWSRNLILVDCSSGDPLLGTRVLECYTIRPSGAKSSLQPRAKLWGRLSMKARPPRKRAAAMVTIAIRTALALNFDPTPAKKRTAAMMTATSTKLSPVWLALAAVAVASSAWRFSSNAALRASLA